MKFNYVRLEETYVIVLGVCSCMDWRRLVSNPGLVVLVVDPNSLSECQIHDELVVVERNHIASVERFLSMPLNIYISHLPPSPVEFPACIN